jgi:hypothetical protein
MDSSRLSKEEKRRIRRREKRKAKLNDNNDHSDYEASLAAHGIAIPREEKPFVAVDTRQAVREARRIEHLYRPDQRTCVVVHKVVFRTTPPKQTEQCNVISSFQGRVIGVETDVDASTGKASATVVVQLIPRKGLDFSNCNPPEGPTPYGIPMFRNDHNKCCIALNIDQLTRDSPFIVLGHKFKEGRDEKERARYTLPPFTIITRPPSNLIQLAARAAVAAPQSQKTDDSTVAPKEKEEVSENNTGEKATDANKDGEEAEEE